MKHELIEYDLISNSNGIRKYGFYYNLKNKHKIKNYFSPTIDWSRDILKYFQITCSSQY